MDEADELSIYKRSRTDKTYVGSSIQDFKGRRLRIGNKYLDAGPGYSFCDVKDEVTLRHSPGGRVHIKATFMEDDRAFQTVTLQKFTGSGLAREHFTFMPDEIVTLLNFLTNLKQIHFPDAGKVNITDADLEQLLLQPDQLRRIVADNQELLAAVARNEITSEDVVALGYRKRQLREFERLLDDRDHFLSVLERHPKGRRTFGSNSLRPTPGFSAAACRLSILGHSPIASSSR